MEKLILDMKNHIMREFRMKNDAEFACCMAAVAAVCIILL